MRAGCCPVVAVQFYSNGSRYAGTGLGLIPSDCCWLFTFPLFSPHKNVSKCQLRCSKHLELEKLISMSSILHDKEDFMVNP